MPAEPLRVGQDEAGLLLALRPDSDDSTRPAIDIVMTTRAEILRSFGTRGGVGHLVSSVQGYTS